MIELLFPRHEASLHLEHNANRANYETVAQWVAAQAHGSADWVSEEQKQKAMATNNVWTLQWYPNTPVGFCILTACDLDVLLAAAVESDHQ